jgi:hypothetical protein
MKRRQHVPPAASRLSCVMPSITSTASCRAAADLPSCRASGLPAISPPHRAAATDCVTASLMRASSRCLAQHHHCTCWNSESSGAAPQRPSAIMRPGLIQAVLGPDQRRGDPTSVASSAWAGLDDLARRSVSNCTRARLAKPPPTCRRSCAAARPARAVPAAARPRRTKMSHADLAGLAVARPSHRRCSGGRFSRSCRRLIDRQRRPGGTARTDCPAGLGVGAADVIKKVVQLHRRGLRSAPRPARTGGGSRGRPVSRRLIDCPPSAVLLQHR